MTPRTPPPRRTDGGFLIAGFSSSGAGPGKSADSLGKGDGWVVRLPADGTALWDKTFGGAGLDGLRLIVADPGDGWQLVGTSTSNACFDKPEDNRGETTSSDFWGVRIDKDWRIRWDRTLGGSLQEYSWYGFGAVR